MSHLLDLSESGPKYAMVDPVPDDFPSDAFTLSMYVCTDDQRASALLSYGVEGDGYDANELLLFQPRDLGVWIAGQSHSTGVDIADGRLHAVVLTWDRATGAAKLYVDGLPVAGWAASGRALRGGGCLIIGQDQDERGGGFAEGNALRGTVGHITLWADVRVPTAARPLCDGLLDPDDAPVVHISPATADLRGLAWQPPRRVDARRLFRAPWDTGALPPAARWVVGDRVGGDDFERVFGGRAHEDVVGYVSLWLKPDFGDELPAEAVVYRFDGYGELVVERQSHVLLGEQWRLSFRHGYGRESFPCTELGDGRPHAIVTAVRWSQRAGTVDLWVDGQHKGTAGVRVGRDPDEVRFVIGGASTPTSTVGVRVSDVLLVDSGRHDPTPSRPLGIIEDDDMWILLTSPSDAPLALPVARRVAAGRMHPVDGSAFGDPGAPPPEVDEASTFSLTFWLACRTRCADDVFEYRTPGGGLVVRAGPDGLRVRVDGDVRLEATGPQLDTWVCVAIVGRADGMQLYVYGILAASHGSTWPLPLGGRLRFGGRETLSVRDLALWKQALPVDDLPALGRTLLRVDDDRLLYLASSETADAQGACWSDEGWLTFVTPPEVHAIVRPVPPGFPDEALSITFWIHTDERGHEGTIVSYFANGRDDLIVMRPHALTVNIGGRAASTGVDVADGRWHFVALSLLPVVSLPNSMVWQARLYVDGDERWSDRIGPSRAPRGGGSLVIGQEQDAAGGDFVEHQALRGEVSHVALWSQALTAERVRAEMDRVPAGDDLYLLISPETATPHETRWPADTCLTLADGTQRAVMADVQGMPTHRWSVTLWVRTAQRGVYNGAFSYAAAAGSANELLIWRLHALEVWVAGERFKTGLDIADDRWHFVAVTFADEWLSVFVDGMRAWRSQIGPRVIEPDGILVLGQDQDRVDGRIVTDESQAFVGQLDDVTVWDHALSHVAIGELFERPLGIDEPGRVMAVDRETADLEGGAAWQGDRLHPALARLAALTRLRRWLDGAGFRLRPQTFTTADGITAELTMVPDYSHFETLGLSVGRASGPVSVEVEDLFDPRSTITLRLSPRIGVADVLAVTHTDLVAQDAAAYRADREPARTETGWRARRFAGMFRGGAAALAVIVDRSAATPRYSLAGEDRLFGLPWSGTFALTPSGAIEAEGRWEVGGGPARLSLHVRCASGVALLESCSLFGGKVSLSDQKCHHSIGGLSTGLLDLDAMRTSPDLSLEEPFGHRGTMAVELGRVWDSGARALDDHLLFYWSFSGDVYHTRISARWYGGRAAPRHLDVRLKGSRDGETLVFVRRVSITDFVAGGLDERLDGIWETGVALIAFQEDLDAVRGELQVSGSLDLVDLVDRLVDSTPEKLDALRGLLTITDIETEPAALETRVVVSGQVELLGVPGGDIAVELTYKDEAWVFEELRATTGLSYADTNGVLDLSLTARAWLEVDGVGKSLAASVGIFDGFFDVELPELALSLPLSVPDLLDRVDIGLPAIFSELGGDLELRFDEQSIAVTWDPKVSADFWIGELSATATIRGEVSLANDTSVSLKAGFVGEVFSVRLDPPAVELRVSELKSVAGLSRVFLRAAEAFISEFNPADFAIRFVLGVGEALWDAAGAAIEAVGDVLGLSGEEEGSKVGFMEFVRTAVMWKGRYYFFHGAKDTVWCINDRDVDGDWPKSASGSWTHMPVIGQGNPLRNILKVRASVSGTTRTLLVLDFARGAIGRSYIIGEPFERALTVRWHGKARLPDDIHTSIYWVGKGTFVFHGDGLVSKVSATVSGSTLKLTMSGTERVTKANGWWDAEDFTVVPACAVEGDRDGGADDTDKLYFFDFRTDRFIRCSHPANSSPSSKLTIDADFPRKITTGWL